MKNANETPFKARQTKSGGHSKYEYLVNWYIAVAKKRGWNEVVKLLKQYPEDEENIKTLIKQRLGK